MVRRGARLSIAVGASEMWRGLIQSEDKSAVSLAKRTSFPDQKECEVGLNQVLASIIYNYGVISIMFWRKY